MRAARHGHPGGSRPPLGGLRNDIAAESAEYSMGWFIRPERYSHDRSPCPGRSADIGRRPCLGHAVHGADFIPGSASDGDAAGSGACCARPSCIARGHEGRARHAHDDGGHEDGPHDDGALQGDGRRDAGAACRNRRASRRPLASALPPPRGAGGGDPPAPGRATGAIPARAEPSARPLEWAVADCLDPRWTASVSSRR